MENLAHRLEADAIMAAQCVGMPFEFRNTQEFVGREGFRLFYDFVYSDLMTNGGYVSVANFDERLFCEYYGEEPKSNRHIARMNDMIRLRDESYCMNLLVCEGEEHYIARGYAKYRWIKKPRLRIRVNEERSEVIGVPTG